MNIARSLSVASAILTATAVAGCGGGLSPAAPARAPISSQSAAPITPSGSRVGASLTFTIPAGKKGAAIRNFADRHPSRRPKYVSQGSLGVVVTATSTSHASNNEIYGYDLYADATCVNTESNSRTCTLPIALYADSYTITIAMYDQVETGKAAAPAGNLLSIDTEPETITIGMSNPLTNFILHAQVDYFEGEAASGDTDTFGAVGGTAQTNIGPYTFVAEDAQRYQVDFSDNPTTYHNAPLAASAADLGDVTGCTAACFHAKNDVGTSPGMTTTISQLSDETFTLQYSGGGGPGTGVKNSVAGGQPVGQHPYAGQITAVAANGSGVAGVVPLFAYPVSLSLGSTTSYVWAAQFAPPSSADPTGTSYSAYFTTPGNTSCSNGGETSVATVGTGTYYAGYGMVFPVTTGQSPGRCTLTLSDGASPADVVTVPITNDGTDSCINATPPDRGNEKRSPRVYKRLVTTPGAAPSLLQSITGTASAAFPNTVTAGDTIVFIAGDVPSGVGPTNDGAVQLTFSESFKLENNQSDLFVFTATAPSSGNIGTVSANDGCNAAFWLGEFSGTSEAAIESANAGDGESESGTATSLTTNSIVPDAANGLVMTAADSVADTVAANASVGYREFFQNGPTTSLDVQLATSPTTDTTDPVSNTFAPLMHPDEALIFQIPPASFMGAPPATMNPSLHHPHHQKRRPK